MVRLPTRIGRSTKAFSQLSMKTPTTPTRVARSQESSLKSE